MKLRTLNDCAKITKLSRERLVRDKARTYSNMLYFKVFKYTFTFRGVDEPCLKSETDFFAILISSAPLSQQQV